MFLLLLHQASADEIKEFYNGVRSLGMGGAYVTVVNDETSLLYNPAGLGKLRDYFVTLLDPEIEMGFQNTDVLKVDNALKTFNVQTLLDELKIDPGKRFHTRGQLFPSIVLKNAGLGLFVKQVTDAEVETTGTTYTYQQRTDWAATFGFSLRLFSGIIKIGLVGRAVNRTDADLEVPATSTNLSLETYRKEGLGVAGDAGIMIAFPIAWLPTIGATIKDMGNTAYNVGSGAFYDTLERPATTRQTIDAGIGLFPMSSNNIRYTITADFHDITHISDDVPADVWRRIHGGLEMNIRDFLFLRAGANQGYWSAGLELATERVQIQGAAYGEEIGTSSAKREDRRWVGKFALRF